MDSKTILSMSTEQQISYWLGVLLVAIGRGDVRAAIFQIICFYQTEAYERGQAAAAKKPRSRGAK
jgi:hypothetical protein